MAGMNYPSVVSAVAIRCRCGLTTGFSEMHCRDWAGQVCQLRSQPQTIVTLFGTRCEAAWRLVRLLPRFQCRIRDNNTLITLSQRDLAAGWYHI
jgi:hypothetical protein